MTVTMYDTARHQAGEWLLILIEHLKQLFMLAIVYRCNITTTTTNNQGSHDMHAKLEGNASTKQLTKRI